MFFDSKRTKREEDREERAFEIALHKIRSLTDDKENALRLYKTQRELTDRAMKRMQEAEDAVTWRNAFDEVPVDDGVVLTICDGHIGSLRLCDAVYLAMYDKREKKWYADGGHVVFVKWWLPIPKMPEVR